MLVQYSYSVFKTIKLVQIVDVYMPAISLLMFAVK